VLLGRVATWTTLKVLDWTATRFGEAGLASPRFEAQVLLAHVLGCTRVQLYTNFDRPLEEQELAAYRGLIKRRLGGECMAYLVGEQEFWSMPFWVDRTVLVPRRDTETVVEALLDRLKDRTTPRTVIDVCTGSGCIAVTLARELLGARVVATDVSEEAAALARRNAERNGMGDRVEVRVGDLLAPVAELLPVDVLVSNPPYVATGDIDGLAPEVRNEPRLALDGGADGLDLLRRLISAAPAAVNPGGWLALEHGFDQGDRVAALVADTAAFTEITTKKDLGGQPRVTIAKRR
jgi:release factor glutamine methyltransferase